MNQQLLCNEEVIGAVMKVMDSDLSPAGPAYRHERMECKRHAAELLTGFAEGQPLNSPTHHFMNSSLEMKSLVHMVQVIGTYLAENEDRLLIEYDESGLQLDDLDTTRPVYIIFNFKCL